MTMQPDLDRTLATWLEAERPAVAPDGLLDDVIGEVAQTPRRPGWQVLDRWTWTATATRLWAASRTAALVAVVVLLLAALVAMVLLVGGPRPAPPFGLTRAGYIAFDTPEGDRARPRRRVRSARPRARRGPDRQPDLVARRAQPRVLASPGAIRAMGPRRRGCRRCEPADPRRGGLVA